MRRYTIIRWLLCVVFVATGSGVTRPAQGADVPHVLVFTGTLGYRHGGIPHMVDVIEHLSELTGAFTTEHSEDPSVFTEDLYGRVDGMLFLQVTGFGNVSLTDEQKANFLRFFSCGGAFVGVHATSDSSAEGNWEGFNDLVGAQFESHPHFGSLRSYRDAYDDENQIVPEAHSPLLQEFDVIVEDQQHPATEPWHGETRFRSSDEIYRYRDDPRDVDGLNVLLSIDPETDYWPAAGIAPNPRRPAGEVVSWAGYTRNEPIAWTKTYGAGRVFYTNLGHNPETWDGHEFQRHLLNGLEWATTVRPDAVCATG